MAKQGSMVSDDSNQIRIYKPTVDRYKLKMLVYGPPGVGKTSFAVTANLHEMTAPALLLNVEGGVLSVTDPSVLGLDTPPDTIDITSYADLEPVFWFLAGGDHQYQTVIIDSLSELQIRNIDHVVQRQLNRMASSGAKRDGIDDVWVEDYGKSTQQLRRWVRNFRDLPMHVIMTCHHAVSVDKLKEETVHPALTPKLRTSVVGYMDIVAYMYTSSKQNDAGEDTGEITRHMLCRPLGLSKWMAKDRSPGQRLGTVVDNPSVPKVMQLILGTNTITSKENTSNA